MNDSVAKMLEGFVPMREDQAARFSRQEHAVALADAQLKQHRAEEELAKMRVRAVTARLSVLLQEINALNVELGTKDPREDVKEFEGRLYVRKLVAPENANLALEESAKA